MAMNKLTLLLEKQSQPTLKLRIADTSIKTAGPEENIFTVCTGLQKIMKNIESYKTTQTQPSHLPQGLVHILSRPIVSSDDSCDLVR